LAPGDAVPGGDYGLVVDGLFGIGLRALSPGHAELVARINALPGRCWRLTFPSGIDGDTGRVMGIAVRATHTLSFIGGKPGLYTLDGPDHCGEVRSMTSACASTDSPAPCSRPTISAPASSRVSATATRAASARWP
jgi:hypothetical protein